MYTTTLMLTAVLHPLPTAKRHAYVCSAGSKGYCALKEMLQNGTPGNTLLLETGDLRDVDSSSVGCCLLTYTDELMFSCCDHIPDTVSHVVVYGNVSKIPEGFVVSAGLVSIDLSPLSQVTQLPEHFLMGCARLTKLDLGPLSQIVEVPEGFLGYCTGLSTLDLSPLSQVAEVQAGFLDSCTGLSTVDLSPLSRITVIRYSFLSGCTGLKTLDLCPLSQVTKVEGAFLSRCTGLTSLDLSSLSQITEVGRAFLHGCTGLNIVDNPPPLCDPPSGWSKGDQCWVRDLSQSHPTTAATTMGIGVGQREVERDT